MADNTPVTHEAPPQVEALLATPEFSDALKSKQFRRFLDQVPIAIAVSELGAEERIVYVNPEFERVSSRSATAMEGRNWTILEGRSDQTDEACDAGDAIVQRSDFVGTFRLNGDNQAVCLVDIYSNIIEDEDGTPCYRLAALVDVNEHATKLEERDKKVEEKATLLLEIQHRVRNNLQMITALIRMEARHARGKIDTGPFDRLAGRIEAIQLLYSTLVEHGAEGEVDLGLYISEIATSVLRAHSVEGIRLDLQVDTWPVSVNVAMPTGLVVNELLTNTLKYAFSGRSGGTITVHSLADAHGCRIIVADDGIGLPPGVTWPKPGKLSALIVQSLVANAKATIDVQSNPGTGMRVAIAFSRQDAAPESLSAPASS